MHLIVYIEPTADGYRASPFTPAEFVGVGATEAEAVQKLQERFAAGRIAVIDVPTFDPPPDPVPPVGFDAPGHALSMAGVAFVRQQSEAEESERERLAEQTARP